MSGLSAARETEIEAKWTDEAGAYALLDADGIAVFQDAKDDVAYLLAEVRRLRADNQQIREAYGKLREAAKEWAIARHDSLNRPYDQKLGEELAAKSQALVDILVDLAGPGSPPQDET